MIREVSQCFFAPNIGFRSQVIKPSDLVEKIGLIPFRMKLIIFWRRMERFLLIGWFRNVHNVQILLEKCSVIIWVVRSLNKK